MAQDIVKYFREARYGDTYGFRYVREGETWKIFCLQRPPNSRFPAQASVTHIFEDHRLCIAADAQPKTFEQAVSRSWKWLSGYSTYVRTGRFPDIRVRVITPDYDDNGQRV